MLRISVEVALTVGLAYVAGQAIWFFLAPAETGSETAISSEAVQAGYATQTVSSRDLSILTSLDPFNTEDAPANLIDSSALDAPETTLNLTLQGVRANGDGAGVAFITLPDNRQLRATVGDQVLDNVTLEYVFADRVTINTRGQLETLYHRDLDRQDGILSANNGALREPQSVREQPVRASAPRPGEPVTPGALLGSVTLATMRRDGQRFGYLIEPRTDERLMVSVGFEPGDIITSVEGIPISEINGEDLQELVMSSPSVDFEVDRDGDFRRVSVTFAGGSN